MGKAILFVSLWLSLSLHARQLHTIRSGSWEADSVWYNQMVPDSLNDTILVLHHVELNSNITLSTNDYLHIAPGAWLCGNVDLYMYSNSNLINEGFLGLYYWEIDGGSALNDSTGYIDLGEAGGYFTNSGTYFDNDAGCMLVHPGAQTCLCAIDTDIQINTTGRVIELIVAEYAPYQMYIDNDYAYFFGDGSNIDTFGTTISHTYMDTGTYPVMIIFYGCCATDTVYRSVHITPSPCLCQNDTMLNIVLAANIAIFETDSQSGDSYHYIFGDGSNIYTTAALQNHTYPDSGLYRFILIVTNCCHTDTLYRSIYISPPCLNDQALTLGPNPADGGFTVNRQYCMDENVSIKLYTLSGQIMASYLFATTSQMLHEFIPTDKLPSGCYIADMESAVGITRAKVIVIHPY